ncbi:MAG: DUF6465 family protein [Butyrivibrio sp.]|jgi:hypothetical protein|uniref:DUF6465 family protein n=1 Tax=Butyrivibrio sp. LB2008 TaxID=1408305 RepID=UPI000479E79A|nr:DUF6465 family protein [Butyrivibrio sp. LB2008]MEE3495475.1 DUF6465 family protein [Butyrivibrio sp.]
MAATTIKTKVEIQYEDLTVTGDQLISKAKKAYGKKDIKDLNIYVKPEERMGYYVVNGSENGSFDL